MNTNNNKKNLGNSSENEEDSSSETTTIVFETETGEVFAEVELPNEEYEALLSDAEKKGITFSQLLIEAIERELDKEGLVKPQDD